MNWEIATAQSRGGRTTQEDALAVLDQRGGRPLVLVLADGAGGHADGERASQAAIKRLEREFAAAPTEASAAAGWLAKTIAAANADVLALGSGASAPRTTIVAVWVCDTALCLASLGDSRWYHFRAGKLVQRSRDDSVVQLLVDMKKIDEHEALKHPDRSRLLKALGAPELDLAPPVTSSAARGDGLVLCSDGIWEHAPAKALAEALAGPDLERAATDLVRLAVGKGGASADNASIILARLV